MVVIMIVYLLKKNGKSKKAFGLKVYVGYKDHTFLFNTHQSRPEKCRE